MGFTVPHTVTGGAVRSYRTLSPLPVPLRARAVYSLLHFPSRHRASPLASMLPVGVRTFLRPALGQSGDHRGALRRPWLLSYAFPSSEEPAEDPFALLGCFDAARAQPGQALLRLRKARYLLESRFVLAPRLRELTRPL